MGAFRDILLSLGSAVTGAGIALFASGTKAQPTDTRIAGALVALGVLAFVVYGLLAWWEAASHNKQALNLVFEGNGSPCVYDFEAREQDVPMGTTHTLVPAVTGSASPGGNTTAHTLVRLHVRNLRPRPLKAVTVRVHEASPAYDYMDYLKWMHDDDEGHVRSLQGITVEPGTDSRAYIDLATKSRLRENFALEFAQRHLRDWSIKGPPAVCLHLIASGQEESGLHVPDCHRAFLLEPAADGGLNVVPKSLSECGFL